MIGCKPLLQRQNKLTNIVHFLGWLMKARTLSASELKVFVSLDSFLRLYCVEYFSNDDISLLLKVTTPPYNK